MRLNEYDLVLRSCGWILKIDTTSKPPLICL